MNINEWAIKHHVSMEALVELYAMFGVREGGKTPKGDSESVAQQLIRLDASKRGNRLWRNNIGVANDKTGRPIRFGLANDSQKMNQTIKSSDLIGIERYTVKSIDVGSTVGLFKSIEVKPPGWKYTGTPREKAQLNWIKLIISLGGRAQFATGPDDVL